MFQKQKTWFSTLECQLNFSFIGFIKLKFSTVLAQNASLEGWREGGPMRGLGIYHLISGPIRGIRWRRQTDRHADTQTDIATL